MSDLKPQRKNVVWVVVVVRQSNDSVQALVGIVTISNININENFFKRFYPALPT